MLKVLCLDIEGGHGGSSRSLYFALSRADLSDLSVTVWCRRGGPIEQMYAALGIPCVVEPDLPALSALPRWSRNVLQQAIAFTRCIRARRALKRLEKFARDTDVVHFNHEGFYAAAQWLRSRGGPPATMHVRTCLHDTWFARRQVALASAVTDARVFITENELAQFAALGGNTRGAVIYNPVVRRHALPSEDVPVDDRLNVACLSNFSYLRGIDRLIEVAAAMPASSRARVRFVVAGDMQISRTDALRLGVSPASIRDLAAFARHHGVADSFRFLGHVSDPERVLSACQVLAKPTREYNPWGRDILEALAAGLPVFSIGNYRTFVESGVTGLLQAEFDAGAAASWLLALDADRSLLTRMGQAAANRVADLCDATRSAAELARLWRAVARKRRPVS